MTTRADVDTRSSRRGRVITAILLVLLGLIGALVVLTALGALVPVLGPLSGAATLVVPAIGLPLAAGGFVVALVAWLLRSRSRRVATVVAVGTLLGSAALGGSVAAVVVATTQAGGSVDLLSGFTPSTGGGAPDERVVYTTGPDGAPLHLSTYRPPPTTTGPVPVLVYVHGGGWVAGSDLDAAADMRWFADRGRLVVSVQYTLARPGLPTWDVAGPQVACALSQIVAVAADNGGDPTRVVLAGDSAGGQLAVSVGYRAAAGTQASSCGDSVPVPQGVAVQYPAVDLLDAYATGEFPARPDLDARGLGLAYTGGTPEQVPERYLALAGGPAITPAAPPTLVLGPTRDDLVPPGGVARFVDQARAAGVDAELVPIPFANHAYDTLGAGTLGNQARRTITERWLAERGL